MGTATIYKKPTMRCKATYVTMETRAMVRVKVSVVSMRMCVVSYTLSMWLRKWLYVA